MHPLCQGINVMPGFVIGMHSTLDMLVILRDTYKNSLVTEKPCNQLSLSLGNEPRLRFFHYWGVTTRSVVSPLLPLTMDASFKYTINLGRTDRSLWNMVVPLQCWTDMPLIVKFELSLRSWALSPLSTRPSIIGWPFSPLDWATLASCKYGWHSCDHQSAFQSRLYGYTVPQNLPPMFPFFLVRPWQCQLIDLID